ncbi:MAG: hypothetical protein J0H31_30110, partial [Alphaproteobacteria bacterium]|nr:hypothetical protein [Alphaproteobacteria bacterium]
AARDWPATLRERVKLGFKSQMNLGLGLRWVAALAHFDRYADIGESLQCAVKEEFVRSVRSQIGAAKGLFLHPDDDGDHLGSRAMVPLSIICGTGPFASLEQCQSIQVSMRSHDGGPVCHIGQAVRLGPRAVLRAAASAADVIDVVDRMSAGQSLHEAFRPIESRLDEFFQKLAAVLRYFGDI